MQNSVILRYEVAIMRNKITLWDINWKVKNIKMPCYDDKVTILQVTTLWQLSRNYETQITDFTLQNKWLNYDKNQLERNKRETNCDCEIWSHNAK